jgi:ABC-type glutathione transport system ATPase component
MSAVMLEPEVTATAAPPAGPLDDGASRDVVIDVADVTKTYGESTSAFQALRGVSFAIRPGEFVAITGPSGSRKSTMMNVLGCLDTPSSGHYSATCRRGGPRSSTRSRRCVVNDRHAACAQGSPGRRRRGGPGRSTTV